MSQFKVCYHIELMGESEKIGESDTTSLEMSIEEVLEAMLDSIIQVFNTEETPVRIKFEHKRAIEGRNNPHHCIRKQEYVPKR